MSPSPHPQDRTATRYAQSMSSPKRTRSWRRLAWNRRVSFPDNEEDRQRLLPRAESRDADSRAGAVSGLKWGLNCLRNIKLGTGTAAFISPSYFQKPTTAELPLKSDSHPNFGADSDVTPDPLSQYCMECQQARASPEYAKRVASLTDPLYCAGCQSEHAAILFSHPSRRKKSTSRLCIGRQGYYTACPHLKFSLADIEVWKAADGKMELYCQDPLCPCTRVSITYERDFPSRPERSESSVWITWNEALDKAPSSGNGTPWDHYMAKMKQLYASYPALLCPTLQVTPDRLFQPAQFKHHGIGSRQSERSYVCDCGFMMIYDSTGECEQMMRAACHIGLRWHPGGPMPRDWIKMIDPNSYGHFTDLDTRHIAWCSDRSCATTRDLARFWALISMGACHAGESIVQEMDKVQNGSYTFLKM